MADEIDPIPDGAAPEGGEIAPATETAPVEERAGEEKKEKLNQQVLILDVGPCRKHIKVTVDRADVDKLLDAKYKELVSDSAVPGFRPGRAPRQVGVRPYHKQVSTQTKNPIPLPIP